MYFGRYFADPVAALDLHMPPGAFVGYDGQSDREAATFLNGYLEIQMSRFSHTSDLRILDQVSKN